MSQDLYIDCVECNDEFVFSVSDQEYYQSKGFEDPKRCSACRQARKGGRRPSEGGNRRPDHVDRGGRGRLDEVLLDEHPHYKIRCRACRREAFVPFYPKGPACCQECHHENKTRSGGRMAGARS